MGAQWCSVADSQLSQHMKTVHVVRLLAGGLSRQSRGGVAWLRQLGKGGGVCVFVWAYLPIDREAIKGNFLSPPIPPSQTVAKAGT